MNTDEMKKSLERPAFVADGVRYEGRILSIFEWWPWAERIKSWELEQLSPESGKKEIEDFLVALGFSEDAILAFGRLENPIALEVLWHFFDLQRRVNTPHGPSAAPGAPSGAPV